MEIDPFIFRLSIFILSIFIGYYVVWSVTPSLHTPLMSVTNAISSVIIVGAIIAGLAGNSENIFSTSSILGFLAISLAAINIFGGFLVTQRMLQMYKIARIVISRNIQTRKFLWNFRNGNSNYSNFFIYWKFFKWIYLCINFFTNRWLNRSFYSIQDTNDSDARTSSGLP